MKMSREEALKRLKELGKQAKELSLATRATVKQISQLTSTISSKKDVLKAEDYRKQIERL